MPDNYKPLADRLRPTSLDAVLGQQDILAPDKLLYKMIKQDVLSSMILYGPPGTGKTTLAKIIAEKTHSEFKSVNAVSAGKKDLADVCHLAEKNKENNVNTILFIDEIHRFNKAQQDFLLPFVENGTIILIGATTENPYFEVIPALVSRCQIFQMQPLSINDLTDLIRHAVSAELSDFSIDDDAVTLIAEQADGDARYSLTILELSSLMCDPSKTITAETVKAVIQKPRLSYDKDGDNHYDTISAFIKSMRGSDPDATLYYLARMIIAGEDPKFIARRIVIAASEDVSNADPLALCIATNAALAVERIGMPEGRIILAQAATYIAMAPKSNSAIKGIDAAMAYVKQHPSCKIPGYLCDAHYKSAAKLGHGIDYDYPHAYPDHWCKQQYLPTDVNESFYKNSHLGYEAVQADYQNKVQCKK